MIEVLVSRFVLGVDKSLNRHERERLRGDEKIRLWAALGVG
jgi:hypothetical protein